MKITFKAYITEELERFIAAGIKNTEYYKHKLDVYMGTGIIMLVLAFALGFPHCYRVFWRFSRLNSHFTRCFL